MSPELAWIAEATGASSIRRGARIQSLWGGYGELFRVELEGAAVPRVVVKEVNPPARRGRSGADGGDARKRRSYEIETTFYETFASRCDASCRVPAFVASRVSDGRRYLVLEDLDAAGFSLRRHSASSAEIDVCLSWLATFHARFLGTEPRGLWKTGTYWHLATRREELLAIDDAALRAAAPILDERLAACTFQTIVHGDAKLANFCFARNAAGVAPVAAVDFQYVGGGCGMKDVAYLLCGHFGDEEIERRHLETYFRFLRGVLAARSEPPVDVSALEAEWRALYPIACADFYRFFAGWAKDQWRRDAYGQALVRKVLGGL